MRLMKIMLFIVCFVIPIKAQIIPKQMVSWSDFSHITCLAIGPEFALFGTTEGILRYQRFEHAWYEPLTVSDGLADGYIYRLAVTSDGNVIYAKTKDGTYSYNVNIKQWNMESSFPEEYFRDYRPRIPLPRMYMPFGYSMSPQGYVSDNELRDFKITAVLNDNFNTIFVGTWGLGPLFADNRDYETTLAKYGLVQKRTDAIFIDGDSLWAGGNEGDRLSADYKSRFGVTLFERSKQKFTWFEPRFLSGFDSEIIYDITGDAKHLYFAGLHGLTILKRKDGSFTTLNRRNGLPADETTALAIRHDSLWIGTSRGLVLYSPLVDTMTVISRKILGNMFITDLLVIENKLIIGTAKGAYYIDFKTRQIGTLKDPQAELLGEIRSISAYKNELLICSDNGATIVNFLSGKSRSLPYVNGYPGAYAGVANANFYAIATEDGLMLITRQGEKRHLLTTDDGLLSIKISTLVVDNDGYVWIGSEDGLTRFDWNNPERVD